MSAVADRLLESRKRFGEEFVAAWNSHDAFLATAMWTDDCVFEPFRGPHPWGDRVEGKRALQEWAADIFRSVPDIRWVLIGQLVDDHHVVLEFRVTGTPMNGEPFDVHTCDVLSLHDNLIAVNRAYGKVGDLGLSAGSNERAGGR